MSAFYRALAQGIAEPEALQQAQRALAGQHPHPFWWAAFAVHA
jgi:CHAT domain-containing protein